LIFAASAGVVAATMVTILGPRSTNAQPVPASALPETARGVSVMAYNVEGLPWPFAFRRPQALTEIAQRLRSLRFHGEQPQVLVLEEAFTPTARSIGRESGYRSVVAAGSATPFGSGLEIATDLPILDVKRFTYPACAGFDCLAAKGAMLATVAVSKEMRVQIAATHLNAHKASGSDDSHANSAYFAQVDELSRFIAANRDPALPLVVVGDFNTYPPLRRNYLMRESRFWRADDALDRLGFDVGTGKDRQFVAPGAAARLSPVAIKVPFGKEPDGSMLSNHVGYAIQYRRAPALDASRKG
jgi:endonuclease/exonuclease/phosphatase family metal-dependent hydrolase